MITSLIFTSLMISAPEPKPQTVEERAKDWRNGAIVYQVFVDRFVPPADVARAKSFYLSPRTLKDWKETPRGGKFSPEAGVWTHELDFWGGNLAGILSKLDYVKELGADVLYLNPVHEAYTNHKYDAIDYKKIDPAFGSMHDLKAVIDSSHAMKMKVVLDGVFNHMGRRSPYFQDAMKSAASPYRSWYFIDQSFDNGYKGWIGGTNMPVNRIEDVSMRNYLWGAKDSVVQSYLTLGIDGWRLDVAYELGIDALSDLTAQAHKAKREVSLLVRC